MPKSRATNAIHRPVVAPAETFYVQFEVAQSLQQFCLDAAGSFVGIADGDREHRRCDMRRFGG
jgi:hypothetical protein